MRAALAAALGGLLSLSVAHGASAIPPSGLDMLSPATSPSGAPMWVVSKDRCPAKSAPHVLRYVEVWIASPAGSLRSDIDEVTGDVESDGSWRVTISAPSAPTAGATASYIVRAACLEDDPWAAAPLDEDTQVKPVAVAYYEVNQLRVTSAADEGATGVPSEFIPDPARFEIVPTTLPPRETTTTTTTTTEPPASAAGATDPEVSAQALVRPDDESERAAEARLELARQSAKADRDVTLSAAPVASRSAPPPADGGAPWWSFVLATMLAVGAVIGYGAKRGSAG